MLRYFIGLTLAQVAIALLVAFLPGGTTLDKLLPIVFLVLLLSTVISLWFGTVARQLSDKRVASLKQQFATEREKLNVRAERAKNRLQKKTQKEIEIQARRARTSANIKVGTALAVAAGFGLVMIFTQFVTLGLLTLTTAGGAVGGYLARSRKNDMLEGPDYKLIEAEEIEPQEVKKIENDVEVIVVNDGSEDKDTKGVS